MNNFRDKLKAIGYDAEEAYFHKREQELIQKTRERNKKKESHLKLLQGGKTDQPLLLPRGVTKKAA